MPIATRVPAFRVLVGGLEPRCRSCNGVLLLPEQVVCRECRAVLKGRVLVGLHFAAVAGHPMGAA